MSVACQGLGASVWYPCKDHQSDEPDNGASLSLLFLIHWWLLVTEGLHQHKEIMMVQPNLIGK
jgi:hypothetical protein